METRRRVVQLSCTWFGRAPDCHEMLTLQVWLHSPETVRRMEAAYPPPRNGVQFCLN
jgi:hypothetical protein